MSIGAMPYSRPTGMMATCVLKVATFAGLPSMTTTWLGFGYSSVFAYTRPVAGCTARRPGTDEPSGLPMPDVMPVGVIVLTTDAERLPAGAPAMTRICVGVVAYTVLVSSLTASCVIDVTGVPVTIEVSPVSRSMTATPNCEAGPALITPTYALFVTVLTAIGPALFPGRMADPTV